MEVALDLSFDRLLDELMIDKFMKVEIVQYEAQNLTECIEIEDHACA